MAREARRRWKRGLALGLGVCAWLGAGPGWSEDSDRIRGYLDLRFGESNPLTKAHDVGGVSLGANLGRYLGFDLSLDAYDLFLDSGSEKVGEIEVLGFAPQVRLRYPLLEDRLTPYLIAGVGAAVAQVNDSIVPIRLSNGSGTTSQVAGVFGAGIEYYVADNVAVGIEGRYLLSGTEEFTAEGTTGGSVDLSAGIATVGLRFLYPELHPPSEPEPGGSSRRRWYFGVGTGGALPVHHQVFPGVTADAEQGVLGTPFTQLFDVAAGIDLAPWLAIELAASAYEYGLEVDGVKVTEYALAPVRLQGRARRALLDGRLEAYALGGVGAEYAEVNDQNQTGTALGIAGKDVAAIGTLGAGAEVRLASNVTLGLGATYLISHGHSIHFRDGPDLDGNLDSVLLSLVLRAFFAL